MTKITFWFWFTTIVYEFANILSLAFCELYGIIDPELLLLIVLIQLLLFS